MGPSGVARASVLAWGLWFVLAESALATGFFINQQSVKGRGRVDAGNAAAADELATIFFNPAGLIEVFRQPDSGTPPPPKGSEEDPNRASFGFQLIVPRSSQRNLGSFAATPGSLGAAVPIAGPDEKNPTDPTPVPNLYFARRLLDGRAAAGLGINVPFGLKADFRPDWFGRYDAIEASLRTWNIGVVGAYQVNKRLAIGGGLDVQYARTTLTTAIPNPFAPGGPSPATDGRIATSGRDWTPGFNVGLMYWPVEETTRVGLHYRHGMKHDIRGTSTISDLPLPLSAFNGAVGAQADLHLPAVASAGVWHKLSDNISLLAGFEWYDWSKFREVVLRFDDGRPPVVRATRYRDTFGVAVGAEYSNKKWSARGGVKYDRTPTTDAFRDTTVPDADRLWLGLGASYRFSDRINVDVGFNHVFFRDTSIALTRTFFDGSPLATSVVINSAVKNVVNTLAVDLRVAF